MTSSVAQTIELLGLRSTTVTIWASHAVTDLLPLLNDHVHLKCKAASNALELLTRYPDPHPPEHWVQTMTAVARDEIEHPVRVTKLIDRRGGRLTKRHRNPYAWALCSLVRTGQGNHGLADRLMVSALIKARSCERFGRLA